MENIVSEKNIVLYIKDHIMSVFFTIYLSNKSNQIKCKLLHLLSTNG